MNAHSSPSTVYIGLHLILIIAPRDRCYPCSTYKKPIISSSSVDICLGSQSEEGAESGPTPVAEHYLCPSLLYYTVSTRDREGVSSSLGSACEEYFKRFILQQKFPSLELGVRF